MRRPAAVLAALALVLVACSGDDGDVSAQTSTTEATTTTAETTTTTAGPIAFTGYDDHEADQYAGTQNWICHPGLDDDVCADLSTTVVAPDGSRTVEAEAAPASDPPVDCFYVYPTTSADPTPAADLDVDRSETDTVRAQAARFGSVCRVFAPAYRQITLGGLGGGASEQDRETAYADVVDAWKTYITEENDGRGVVLIGHSQGAGVLRRLVAEELDGEEGLRDLLVSALLLGSGVPADGVSTLPVCEAADQAGCIVAYASFPADQPPAEGSRFGRLRDTGEPALCVDPVALTGGDGKGDAVLLADGGLLGAIPELTDVETAFVTYVDAVRTSCATNEGFSYLAVELADAADPRPNLSALLEQRLGPTWGLHLHDANLVQDDLIDLVARQAEAHGAR